VQMKRTLRDKVVISHRRSERNPYSAEIVADPLTRLWMRVH